MVYFSLTPLSPSLGLNSPADIFVSPQNSTFSVFYSAAQLALSIFDNVDAIAFDVDSDGDGRSFTTDNCPNAPNPSQTNTDGDDCGNACDADWNGDTVVSAPDYAILGMNFGMTVPPADPQLDSNDDNFVGLAEFVLLGRQFGYSPGPGLYGLHCLP